MFKLWQPSAKVVRKTHHSGIEAHLMYCLVHSESLRAYCQHFIEPWTTLLILNYFPLYQEPILCPLTFSKVFDGTAG